MLTLLFVLLYLLPVFPLARRVSWYVENNLGDRYTIPARKVTRKPSGGYMYVNDYIHSLDGTDTLCQNCGAKRAFHKGGSSSRIDGQWAVKTGHSNYISCDNYEEWDGQKQEWPEQHIVHKIGTAVSIPLSLGISVFWPLALIGVGYKKIDPNWDEFAKPPKSMSGEYEQKKLQARLDKLERDITKQEKEMNVGDFKIL